ERNAMRTPRRVLGCAAQFAAVVSLLVLPPGFGHSQLQGTSVTAAFLQNPAPPCFDNTNRYVNCGNGTVTDTHTGLIWLQDAGCLGLLNWEDANQAAAALENGQCWLTDGSQPGDWRLPSNAEWMAMVDAAKNHPRLQCTNPTLTDDRGSACFGDGSGSSFSNLASDGYWSSTT